MFEEPPSPGSSLETAIDRIPRTGLREGLKMTFPPTN
jgi:hypothetical protein